MKNLFNFIIVVGNGVIILNNLEIVLIVDLIHEIFSKSFDSYIQDPSNL